MTGSAATPTGHPPGRARPRRTGLVLTAVLALVLGLLALAPTTAQAEEAAFNDDFSEGAGAWTTAGGSWSVSDGRYEQTSTDRNARAFAGDVSWSDYTVEASVRPGNGTLTALLGRVHGEESYYYLTLRSTTGTLELNKLSGGSRTLLDSTPFAVSPGTEYTLRLEMSGNSLAGSAGGQTVSATDGEFFSGGVGLKTFNATASFGHVTVTVPDGDDGDDGGGLPPAGTPVGYASMNGGTTGGHGATEVREYLLSEHWPTSGYRDPGEAMYQLLREHRFQPAAEGLVIYVDLTVSSADFGRSKMDVKDVTNVSILGVGTAGEFDGVGFTVSRAQNIVFRNLSVHHVRDGEGTAIEVTNDSKNIWIDHNDFYSELEGAPNKDYYDGLVDIKRNSEYVTVSWNTFHDHWKTMLLGHTDNESLKPDKVTYHHNWFRNVNSRVPLIRYADVHMLNNLFEDVHGSAINSRNGARVLVEGNYFLRTGSGNVDSHAGQIEGPVGWWYGSPATGYWNLVNNVYVDSPHEHLHSTTDWTVPYSYQADSPEVAKQRVEAEAGAGIITVTR